MKKKNKIMLILITLLCLQVQAQNLVTFLPEKNTAAKDDTTFTILDAKINYKLYEVKLADGTSETGNLLNGKKEGAVKRYYANGVLLSITEYKNGIKNGTYIECDKNGTVMREETYAEGQLNGVMKIYASNKNVRYVKSLYHYKNGTYEGPQLEYNDMGKPSSETNYKNGKKHGMSKWFYNNGQLAMEQNYIDEKIDGVYKSYSQEGRLVGQGQYSNGLKLGYWVEYNPNGTLKSEGTYKDDVKTGTWKYYDENGNVLQTETF